LIFTFDRVSLKSLHNFSEGWMRLLAALLLFVLWGPAVYAERMALVIGNGDYSNANPLPNATNDARDMATRLRDMGFTVFEGIDLPQRETLVLVQTFSRALTEEDTALFFYAGHGIQIGSDNYVMPVDAQPGDEDTLADSSIRLQSILKLMEDRANTRIIILDACRNNPFLRGGTTRATTANRGFIKMDAGVGSFIAFSTEPGNVASDGNGRNSPFTAALLRHIGTEDADIHAVMRKVRAEVKDHSNDRQIPWENSSLIDEVYLAGKSAPASDAGRSQQAFLQPAPQVAPQPAPQPQVSRAPAAVAPAPFSHRVQGLDPYGDGFLALRSGITSDARRIAKMPEGTRLNVLQRNGKWYLVQTETGMNGWAHSNWIAPVATLPAAPATPVQSAPSCDELWYQRNLYFARGGYCFGSARGQAAFGHLACTPGLASSQVPLSSQDKAVIAAIQAREAAQGCN
jgi:hypothetical protein